MNKYMHQQTRLLIIILLLFATVATAAERENQVQYGLLETGQELRLYRGTVPGYSTELENLTWVERQKREQGIWAPKPETGEYTSAVLKRVVTLSVEAPETKCAEAPRLLFIQGPDGTAQLYSYEYTLCDPTGDLSPERVVDQYVARYGMYDAKDYDRNMIIYNQIRKYYRVGVRGVTLADGPAAAVITIVDDRVFKNAYFQWRNAIRLANQRMRSKF